jgi:hypothetical protein
MVPRRYVVREKSLSAIQLDINHARIRQYYLK